MILEGYLIWGIDYGTLTAHSKKFQENHQMVRDHLQNEKFGKNNNCVYTSYTGSQKIEISHAELLIVSFAKFKFWEVCLDLSPPVCVCQNDRKMPTNLFLDHETFWRLGVQIFFYVSANSTCAAFLIAWGTS